MTTSQAHAEEEFRERKERRIVELENQLKKTMAAGDALFNQLTIQPMLKGGRENLTAWHILTINWIMSEAQRE